MLGRRKKREDGVGEVGQGSRSWWVVHIPLSVSGEISQKLVIV